MSITVYGASDDLVEIEGDITEEFSFYSDGEERLLAFSDGTLLSIYYDDNGIWRINRLVTGQSLYSKVDGDVVSDTNDVVTLSGCTINWVVFGDKKAIAGSKR